MKILVSSIERYLFSISFCKLTERHERYYLIELWRDSTWWGEGVMETGCLPISPQRFSQSQRGKKVISQWRNMVDTTLIKRSEFKATVTRQSTSGALIPIQNAQFEFTQKEKTLILQNSSSKFSKMPMSCKTKMRNHSRFSYSRSRKKLHKKTLLWQLAIFEKSVVTVFHQC